MEELGRGAVATQRIGAVRVLDGNYVLAVWRASLAAGELNIARDEVAEARWLTPTQIRRIHPSLPSNGEVLELLGV